MVKILNRRKKWKALYKSKSILLVLFFGVVLSNSNYANSDKASIVNFTGLEEVISWKQVISMSDYNYMFVASNIALDPMLVKFQFSLPFLIVLTILFLSVVTIIQLEKTFNFKRYLFEKFVSFHKAIPDDEKQSSNSFETDQKFIEIIAHELTNTFHIMKGYSNHLNEEFDSLSKGEKKKYLNIIDKNIEINYALLKRLLIWNKSSRGSTLHLNKKETDLRLLVENMLLPHLLFASRKKIIIINNLPKELIFKVDKDVLRTVLSNLVNNAIKYSSDNSKVIIDANIANGKIQISIKDQGRGLSTGEIDKLLSRHIKNSCLESNLNKNHSSSSSHGFGINICKYLSEIHNGELHFESKKNYGTKASLILPC